MTVEQEVRFYYYVTGLCRVAGAPVMLLAIAAGNWWLVSHVLFAQFAAMVVQLFTGAVADRLGISP